MECSSEMLPDLKLQKTSSSPNLPLVRFRNLKVITFLAAGMELVSQKPGGAEPSLGAIAPPVPGPASPPAPPAPASGPVPVADCWLPEHPNATSAAQVARSSAGRTSVWFMTRSVVD